MYRFRAFWYTYFLNFGTISGTPYFDLNMILKVKYQVKGYGCVRYPGRLPIVWDHVGTCADVIAGRYPVPRVFTLSFTLKVKCQFKGHGYMNCSVRLCIVLDHFGTPADVISGRYQVPRSLILNWTMKVKCQAKDYGCVCKLLREATYHLRLLWYMCRRNFGTISITSYFALEG